jgi:hypothetical protein
MTSTAVPNHTLRYISGANNLWNIIFAIGKAVITITITKCLQQVTTGRLQHCTDRCLGEGRLSGVRFGFVYMAIDHMLVSFQRRS